MKKQLVRLRRGRLDAKKLQELQEKQSGVLQVK